MTTFPPPFIKAWKLFKDVNIPVVDVGNIIGGKVKANVDSGIFQNACPIRMSYVLNYSGVPVPSGHRYAVVGGGDKKWYIFWVNDMMAVLFAKLGKPDITVKKPTFSDFKGKKGILLTRGHGWSDAGGHVTLWNGSACSDSCHLIGDPDNGTFVPEQSSLWELK